MQHQHFTVSSQKSTQDEAELTASTDDLMTLVRFLSHKLGNSYCLLLQVQRDLMPLSSVGTCIHVHMYKIHTYAHAHANTHMHT